MKVLEINNMSRDELGELFRRWGYKIGAEIGVEAGLYSEVLCKAGLKLYCIDPWMNYENYRQWVNQAGMEKFYEQTKERLKPYDAIVVRKYSMEAIEYFEDGIFDFVYIDGNHDYENVLNDITEWSKKVRSGGTVAGHDYIKRKGFSTHRVVEAVNKYVKDNDLQLFLIGRYAKNEIEIRDSSRSWMFIKK